MALDLQMRCFIENNQLSSRGEDSQSADYSDTYSDSESEIVEKMDHFEQGSSNVQDKKYNYDSNIAPVTFSMMGQIEQRTKSTKTSAKNNKNGKNSKKSTPSLSPSSSSSQQHSPPHLINSSKFLNSTDSALDFSISKKTEKSESCSRLRNILSMKSPNNFETHHSALNLSNKEPWVKEETNSDEMEFIAGGTNLHKSINSINLGPYGLFAHLPHTGLPNLNLPIGFESLGQQGIGNTNIVSSGNGGFNLVHPQTSPLSAPNGIHKARVTRPFKAYPKDPLTFPTVGLYGLPLPTSPSSSESLIHQQSNIAYAEFRKQMLNSSSTRSKRGGAKTNLTNPNNHINHNNLSNLNNHINHNNLSNQSSPNNLSSPLSSPPSNLSNLSNLSNSAPLSDSTTSSTNPLNFGLGGMMEMSSLSNGSGGEDCHSNSDDGYGATAKNKYGKSDEQMKDEAYWERRRKNNEAAKRSRDARRAKEDEIAIRAAFLEQENLKLRFEVSALKNETAKLRCMLYKGQ